MSWDAKTSPGDEFCGVATYRFANAAFCPADYIIGWDRGVMMPAVRDTYGDMGVTILLAHEYGHAVAATARLNQHRTPAIVSELQADCFAGAYLYWVAEGNSPRFILGTGKGLNDLLAVMIAIRDPLLTEGESQRGGEHGSAFERVAAFQSGFGSGPSACPAIDAAEVEARRALLPVQLRSNQTGEWPITANSVRRLVEAMNAVYRPAAPPRLRFADPATTACATARPSAVVSYCPGSDTITIDLPALQAMSAPASRRDDIESWGAGMSFRGFQKYLQSALRLAGDNTGYSVLMSRYMLALQQRRGLALDSAQAGLRTACLTGVATAVMAAEHAATDRDGIALAAGDLDEAIAGLLSNGLAAGDVNGVVLPAGFSRIEAFRTGVLGSFDGCLKRYR